MSSEKPTLHQAPKLSASQRREADQKQRMDMAENYVQKLVQQNNHLLKILWLAIQQQGGRIVVDTTKIPILWQIKKEPQEAETSIALQAGVLPELPEEKVAECGQWLIDNFQERLEKASEQFKFDGYPLPYLELRLQPYVQYNPEAGWLPAKK